MTVVPDAIQPAIGWKAWIYRADAKTHLRTAARMMKCEPRKRMESSCESRPTASTYYKWIAVSISTPFGANNEIHVGTVDAEFIAEGENGTLVSTKPPEFILPRQYRWSLALHTTDPPLPHESPDGFCSCGIHAANELIGIKPYVASHSGIILYGLVHGWGRIIQGDSGWRAQYCYPACFFASSNILSKRKIVKALRPLGEYGVPVHIIEHYEEAEEIAERYQQNTR